MANARLTDPQTSHEAAEQVTGISQTQSAIYSLLCLLPMDDEMLVKAYNEAISQNFNFPKASDSSIRSRRAELVRRGWVKDSGLRSKSRLGRNMIIWEQAR